MAASLTFGGRKVTGDGFGIPIIIRYILETSTTVREAINILNRVPVHMAYNVTLIDATGTFATVYLSPDRIPVVINSPVATNHQAEIEWGDYALLTGTIERKRFLEELVASPVQTEASMIKHFLHPPLCSTNFEKSFGTLYTVIYRVTKGEIDVLWPSMELKQSFQDYKEERVVPFPTILRRGLVT